MLSVKDRGQRVLALVRERATRLGFDVLGVTGADARPDLPEKLARVLANNWHAGMGWMEKTPERRAAPSALWPEARSVIFLGMNYGPDHDPLADLEARDRGNISVYARNRDYHGLIKGRLKEIGGLLARRAGGQIKVFVDTAPVMEKPLAQSAGLGWQGKNTVLTSKKYGSWLFLGAIFTSVELPRDTPHQEHCGTCTRCLDICPTNAFPAPFRLDASRCLAYYNNEHSGPIPLEFRKPMGNRIFGCDDCLAVCPWNKFASAAREARLRARPELVLPDLGELVRLDDAGFRRLFSGSPVRRLGHGRFLRNVLVAIGNSREPRFVPDVMARLEHPDPVVRGTAVWAIKELADRALFERLGRRYKKIESDPGVTGEWEQGLA